MGTDANVCQSRSYALAELAMTTVTQPGIVWGVQKGAQESPTHHVQPLYVANLNWGLHSCDQTHTFFYTIADNE